MNFILDKESAMIEWLAWPTWAMRTVEVLSVLIGVVSLVEVVMTQQGPTSTTGAVAGGSVQTSRAFRVFQIQYLAVYLIIMCADWLQGTNMYTLYASYDVDIGTLFLTGFLSSAVFGTFLGMYVDMWGRRFGCLLFCVLEVVINLVEHVPSMPLLLVGRVLGGMSTSLLFSAFESWMVSEHRKRGFPEEWLAGTFAVCSWGNGVVAILAGFLAQVAADVGGDIGPFQLAIGLTIVALVLITAWEENYGDAHETKAGDDANPASAASSSSSISSPFSLFGCVTDTLSLIVKHPAVLCLGLSQAFFEGAVYTFVFMWVPSMLQLMPPGASLPTGLVFACFMLAMTLGGMVFALVLPIFPGGCLALTAAVFATSAAAMAVPIYCFEFWWVFTAFLVLECMLGMFGSCGGTLRSVYYPEGMQSSIMSLFRLPLNLLVVLGTLLTNKASNVSELQQVYLVVAGMHATAFVFQVCVSFFPVPSECEDHVTEAVLGSPRKSSKKKD